MLTMRKIFFVADDVIKIAGKMFLQILQNSFFSTLKFKLT